MTLRDDNVAKFSDDIFDVLVLGGGINGAVAAAALSAGGARVSLIDKRDFAGYTSQHSSNLAWGGIKYLESQNYCLVRKLCLSRNELMRSFPNRVREIRFFVAIEKGFRFPSWFLWMGTWIYWAFGNGYTRTPRLLSRTSIKCEEPVVDTVNVRGGFEYSDAYLQDNDARFVFQFILTAMDRGCIAANYVESLGSSRQDGCWVTAVRDLRSGRALNIRSRVLINATGPFVDGHNTLTGVQTTYHHVFSKGIHLIVPKISNCHRILTFFADDGRMFFAIPMGNRTCIGTTDTLVNTPYTEVTDEDRSFVLDNINKRLDLPKPLSREDIIAERCGVRPLVVKKHSEGASKDWLQLSRKHVIDVDREHAHLSVFGGKLTDCINVGNEISDVVAGLGVTLGRTGTKWYGEPHQSICQEYMRQAELMNLDSYSSPDSAEPLSSRLWRRYDIRAFQLMDAIRKDPEQARILIQGTDYTRCEIEHAKHREMVVTLEDFLRRRSKIAQVMHKDDIRAATGLMEACRILFGDDAQARFEEYFGACMETVTTTAS